jgi:hypothetical protein
MMGSPLGASGGLARAGPSWSSIAFEVRSLLLPGVQDPSKSVLLHLACASHKCSSDCNSATRVCGCGSNTRVWRAGKQHHERGVSEVVHRLCKQVVN